MKIANHYFPPTCKKKTISEVGLVNNNGYNILEGPFFKGKTALRKVVFHCSAKITITQAHIVPKTGQITG